MSRPPKNADEKFVARQLRFPPDLWNELESRIPRSERSVFIRQALRAALMRRAAARLARYYAEDPEVREWTEVLDDEGA